MSVFRWFCLAFLIVTSSMTMGPMAVAAAMEFFMNMYINAVSPSLVAEDIEVGRGYAAGERDELSGWCKSAMATYIEKQPAAIHVSEIQQNQLAALGDAVCRCAINEAGVRMSHFDRLRIRGVIENAASADVLSRQSLRNLGLSNERVQQVMDASEQRMNQLERQCSASVGPPPTAQ